MIKEKNPSSRAGEEVKVRRKREGRMQQQGVLSMLITTMI
jgi:hypothetical protein